MTREEAIKELNYIEESFVSCELSYKAIDIAIQSLEAWDKVIKEFKDYEQYLFGTTHPALPSIVGTLYDCGNIISKYLKEVEDEHTD